MNLGITAARMTFLEQTSSRFDERIRQGARIRPELLLPDQVSIGYHADHPVIKEQKNEDCTIYRHGNWVFSTDRTTMTHHGRMVADPEASWSDFSISVQIAGHWIIHPLCVQHTLAECQRVTAGLISDEMISALKHTLKRQFAISMPKIITEVAKDKPGFTGISLTCCDRSEQLLSLIPEFVIHNHYAYIQL